MKTTEGECNVHMKSFILIETGDTVFDSTQFIQGVVKQINTDTNVAQIETDSSSEEELILCKLANLVIMKKGNVDRNTKPKQIKVKYFNSKSTKLSKIAQGDWIDLRASKSVEMKAGEFKMIPLGVAMKLPDGYEAIVAPRSSTFKNFGIIETNSIGIIDNSYSGSDDQWFFPAYALRDTTINFDERVCQFRIQRRMPEVEFEEVIKLDDLNRGGHGSTGTR